MDNDTIVAIYDTQTDATAAVRELESAGIPRNAISEHVKEQSRIGTTTTPIERREPNWWQKLFGGEPEYDTETSIYNQSLERGSTIVTVRVGQRDIDKVMGILDRHNPVDIDDRAARYRNIETTVQPGYTSNQPNYGSDPGAERTTAGTKVAAPVAGLSTSGATSRPAERLDRDKTIPLAEEQLVVGKRAVNRGTARIRRYVVETPVEKDIPLHKETVSIERRPVTDAHATDKADFTDKVIEVTESDEEPVISKQARVKEEVVIHKDQTERTERVRDTVRREEVEVDRPGEAARVGARERAGAPEDVGRADRPHAADKAAVDTGFTTPPTDGGLNPKR